MSDIKLKPCPFCGSECVNDTTPPECNEIMGFYWVCPDCVACGPVGDTEYLATTSWNGRVEDVEARDTMQARIDELVFSLDDRDCYIADADMKNAELTARKAELEAMSAEVISMLSSGKYKHDCSKIVGVIIKALKDNS